MMMKIMVNRMPVQMWLTDDVNQEIKLDGQVGKLLEAARKERREKLERGGGGGSISATMTVLQSPSA